MDEQDVKDMAEVTRKHAREEDPDQRTPEGSHGFPAADGEEGDRSLNQRGTSQNQDIHGVAQASGMGQQRVHPSEQRDRPEGVGEDRASGTDGGAES